MEEQLNAGIHTKSGKSLMNAFLRARTAFGFEYLITYALNTAVLTGILRESKDFFSEID